MNTTRQLASVAILGILAFATSNVEAALLTVTISGSATTTKASTNNGTITYKEKKTSVGTQDLLELVGNIKGIGKPADGSTFVYDTSAVVSNIFTIRDRHGAISADCTGVIVFEIDRGATKSGKSTPSTGEISTTTSFFGTVRFAPGNGNQFIVSGLMEDKLSVSKLDNKNTRKVSDTITLKDGSGPASVNGEFATAIGTVTFKGNESVTQPQ